MTELEEQNNLLREQLEEAHDTINAIRTGQIDALVVQGSVGNQLYTLKTADQTYRVFIEKMSEGAVTINQEGIILYSNSKFASMVGLPLSNVIGMPFDNFICSIGKENDNDLIHASWLEDGKGQIILQGDKNRLVYCQVSLTSLQLDEGVCLSIILTDIGVQKETEKSLKSSIEKLAEMNHDLEISNYDLQQFAYVASHDLQEPLRKIHMFSDRIKSKHITDIPVEVGRFLEKIILSTQRMQILITDILSYSRLSDHNPDFRVSDLNLIVMEILEDLELVIEEKKAIFCVDKLPEVEINPGQIRQVFQNLIGNALKFCKARVTPRITITSNEQRRPSDDPKKQDGLCSISIIDNGIGFSEEYAENIFSLFHRLHSKDKYEGTGIGLSIAKKIMEKHKGQITVRSKPGEGSEFTILLPLRQT